MKMHKISRKDSYEIALKYASHKWYASCRHAFHGFDDHGIRVDTPDSDYNFPEKKAGLWNPNMYNTGIPYMWGGFSSIKEFTQGLKNGKYAGDLLLIDSRREISKSAVGIDCSGLVSRCWKLDKKHSTKNLSELCSLIKNPNELKTCDILLLEKKHVMLFIEFDINNNDKIKVIDASRRTGKVLTQVFDLKKLIAEGYKLFKYKNF